MIDQQDQNPQHDQGAQQQGGAQETGAGYGNNLGYDQQDGEQQGGGMDSSGGTGSTGNEGHRGSGDRGDGQSAASGPGKPDPQQGDHATLDQSVQRSETIEAEDIEFEADGERLEQDLIDDDE